MVYFYCVDVSYDSEDFVQPDVHCRVSGVLECDRIESSDQFNSVFNEIKNNLFRNSVQPINNSAFIKDCDFSLVSFNPL